MSIPRSADLTVNKYLSKKDVDIKRKLKTKLEERIPSMFSEKELTLGETIFHLFLIHFLKRGRLLQANKHSYGHNSIVEAEYEYRVVTYNDDDGIHIYTDNFLLNNNNPNWAVSDTTSSSYNTFIHSTLSTTTASSTSVIYTSYTSYKAHMLSFQNNSSNDEYINYDKNPFENPNLTMCKNKKKVKYHLFELEYEPDENYGRYYYHGAYIPVPWIDYKIELGKKLEPNTVPWNPNLEDSYYNYYDHDSNEGIYRIPWVSDDIVNIHDSFDLRNRNTLNNKEDSKKRIMRNNLSRSSYDIKSETMEDERMKTFISDFSKVPWYPDILQIFDIKNQIQGKSENESDEETAATRITFDETNGLIFTINNNSGTTTFQIG